MMNIDEQYLNINKKYKKHIVLTILFSSFVLISVVLFIVLSNYKIETIMKIVGSITSSVLMIALISEIFGWLIPTISKQNFLKELKAVPESKVTGRIDYVSKELITIRKGILAVKVTINSIEYYCHDIEIVSKFNVTDIETFIVRGSFIVGVENEK